ncbi:MAG: HPF/RaiA family ribosome-associated protein [Deltaproteobacteria bacterium]|nr:HPF/RaiA family ribosome-associated protein [Deltaproteobacteria bacterium]
MNLPLQITFHNMSPSPTIEALIREKAAKLDSFYDRIMGCRVTVEAPHRHHRKGKRYNVRIDITVPGGELVINRAPKPVVEPDLELKQAATHERVGNHEPSKYAAHADIHVAVRDAFDAARRKLQDFARRQRGHIKAHEDQPHARVSKLFPDDGFGFLETPDGRELYFHRNSVLAPGFDRLKVGMGVYFAEEQGEKGGQATTVRLMGKHAL